MHASNATSWTDAIKNNEKEINLNRVKGIKQKKDELGVSI